MLDILNGSVPPLFELCLIEGADHRIRHDPRAMAILFG